MGMFDTVEWQCPKCNATNMTQTKAGTCELGHYHLGNGLPPSMAQDMAKYKDGEKCKNCGTSVRFTHTPIYWVECSVEVAK